MYIHMQYMEKMYGKIQMHVMKKCIAIMHCHYRTND